MPPVPTGARRRTRKAAWAPPPPPPQLPPWEIDDATLPGGVVAPVLGSGVPGSALLWEKLKCLSPQARTKLLTRAPDVLGAGPLCGVHVTTGAQPVHFGVVDVAAAARGAAHRVVSIANCGALPGRITDVVLRPADVPFRVVNPPLGVVIASGEFVKVVIAVDMAAAHWHHRTPDAGELQFWCIVGVDSSSIRLMSDIQIVTLGYCVGAELRADLSSWRKSAIAVLDASAQPFFPSEFKKCFEKAGTAALPPICDEDRANALIPPGLRRVVPKVGSVFITCPSRARRTAGEILGEVVVVSGSDEEDDEGDESAVESAVAIGTGFRNGNEPSNGVYGSNDSAVRQGESLEDYQRRMSLGLCLEAEQMFTDIKRYDIVETPLKPVSPDLPLHFLINVQGLSESRPALVLFDPVRLRPTHEALVKSTELIARVVSINTVKGTVTLKLPELCVHNETLSGILERAQNGSGPPLRCHVRFCVGNHFLSNLHMLRVVQKLDPGLHMRLKRPPPIVNSVDLALRAEQAKSVLFDIPGAQVVLEELNARQLEAVFMCIGSNEEGIDSRWPVCVFGPPGTGKTRVLTAAVCVALLKYGRRTRILATAPSHQAADVLCERLSQEIRNLGDLGDGKGPASMFRLNPYQRPYNTARIGTVPHIHQDGQTGFFDLPTVDELAAFNIVVATCMSADLLSELPETHFWTGVFCDESAQSLQPEALIPLNRFAVKPSVRVVLAGDPHQLNADVRSNGALRLGLNLSLMEALMRERDSLPGAVAYNVHLRVNYRVRHPVLLHLPNRMFYGGRLIVHPDLRPSAVVDELRDLFPTGVPLLFAGLRCSEKRVSERSPGLVNLGEAAHITSLCVRMTGGGGGSASALVQPAEITVICPYRVQVVAVRRLLRDAGLDGVKVGTVFDTQGQENRIVFVSLTVSTAASLAAEESRHDGISSAKKFNVAVTRPMEMLCVVGNPAVMVQNAYWGAQLRYAVRNRCYSGVSFPGMDEMVDDGDDGGKDTQSPLRQKSEDYSKAMDELDGGAYDEEDYEDDMEQVAEAFRDSEDMPWRVMI